MAEQARYFDGKKFMWDGKEYESNKEATSAQKDYSDKGFVYTPGVSLLRLLSNRDQDDRMAVVS